jgi:hypothetical protein
MDGMTVQADPWIDVIFDPLPAVMSLLTVMNATDAAEFDNPEGYLKGLHLVRVLIKLEFDRRFARVQRSRRKSVHVHHAHQCPASRDPGLDLHGKDGRLVLSQSFAYDRGDGADGASASVSQ